MGLEHPRLKDNDINISQAWLHAKGFKLSLKTEQKRVPNLEGVPDYERTYAPIQADAIYTRNSSNIVCGLRFVVVLDYTDNKVLNARGMVNETGCL